MTEVREDVLCRVAHDAAEDEELNRDQRLALDRLFADGLVEFQGARPALTADGRRLADRLLMD